MSSPHMRTPQEQRRANMRLAVILASAAAVFALGFVVRMVYFGA
jgi:hypothetical protein